MKKSLLTTLLLLAITLVQAQDIILPKHGNPITAYNLGENNKFILYTAEPNEDADILRIAKDSVLMVRRADGTVMDLKAATAPAATQAPTPTEPTIDYPEIAEEDIHGSLIAKGNCVFIPIEDYEDGERAGQEQLKKKVKEIGYWTVVDKPEQAHFILQYMMVSVGQDMAYLIIRPRKYYKSRPRIYTNINSMTKEVGILWRWCISDDTDQKKNREIINIWSRSLENPEEECSKHKDWGCKRFQKAIDADAKSNNCVVW
ncbi:MAG: hypothetical protein J6X88_09780 [Bacteroidales bacterium]|nr:hypothetical protein [Bacteroidales bacterium]